MSQNLYTDDGVIVSASNPLPVTTETSPNSQDISTALEASAVVKASPGTLYELLVTNTNAGSQFIQIHNTTSVPSDTAVPLDVFYVGANQTVSYQPAGGLSCDTGISVCNSSTAATKTVGASDCWFSARYE